MPEDNSAKKDAAKQEKPYRPYSGPSAAELEPKVISFLPGLRIYFAPDPRYTREQMEGMVFQDDLRQGRIEEKVAAGETVTEAEMKSNLPSQGEIDYILDSERITQSLRQNMQGEVLKRLENYSRATIAEGTFAEKWPAMLANVMRYDTLVAYNAANAVLQDNFADAQVLTEKPEFLTVAKRAFLDMGLRYTITNLSISDAEYKKQLRLDPEYNLQDYENQFVNLLENHFYFARTAGTFATEWPAKMEEASKFAPDLAVRGAARYFERVAIETIDDRPQPVKLNAADFTIACNTVAKACARAAETGDALLALDTMKKVLLRTIQAGNSGALERKDFFALAPAMQAEMEKFAHQSIDQLSDTITKQRAEGGNPILAGRARNDLIGVLGQYFYMAEGKGALGTEWSATMDKVANIDAGAAAAASNLYFADPAKPISLTDFMTTSTKTTELCGKAAAQGYNAAAAETLANVLNHLRLNAQNDKLPGEMRDRLTALGVSASTVEEGILPAAIAESLRDVTMSDAELARRKNIDTSFRDDVSEERLLMLLDEYFYQTMKKSTVASEWPAKLQEITAVDPEIAARAAQTFFTNPRGMITSLDDFKIVCDAAAAASMAAHEKGFSFSAAGTLSAMVRSLDKNIEAVSADEKLMKDFPDVLPSLREMKAGVGQKLETVTHDWEEAVKEKPDDPRDAEQIQKANETYRAFLNTLAPATSIPPPSTPTPVPSGP